MGTTQRKEQRKMKLEKEIIILTKLHQNTDKRELIQNINHVLKAQGIHLNRKVKWICKVTGSPEGTVYTWFTNARCRRENKIPLYALCQMALALRISVYKFFRADNSVADKEKQRLTEDVSYTGICGEMWQKIYGMVLMPKTIHGRNKR